MGDTTLDDALTLGNLRHAAAALAGRYVRRVYDPPAGSCVEARRCAFRVLSSLNLAVTCLRDAELHQAKLSEHEGASDGG